MQHESGIKTIMTDDAPRAIGPYSQAVSAGGFVFISGQLPLNPATGDIVPTGIKEQTAQVLENINAILVSAGLSTEHVVKTEVFLKDIGHFAAMNEVYASFFTGRTKPARFTVQVSRLPMEALIEIACTAYS
jgi:2-iminobutanoate/2-iminopropanoate deaminase